MRGDLPQAALNLLASLPVRVHKAPEPVSRWEAFQAAKRAAKRRGLSNEEKTRPVQVRGREFASIREAVRKLHVSRQTVIALLANGEANYIDKEFA